MHLTDEGSDSEPDEPPESTIKKKLFISAGGGSVAVTSNVHSSTGRMRDCGGTVVKVLCYKSEGHWFDPRWCHWNFSLT